MPSDPDPTPPSPAAAGARPRRARRPSQAAQAAAAATARKLGFYANEFSTVELSDLDTMLETGLTNEIALLRVFTRRVAALANGVDDLEEAIYVLGALGMSSARLASLLRTQKLIGGDERSGILAALSQALSEVIQEMGVVTP